MQSVVTYGQEDRFFEFYMGPSASYRFQYALSGLGIHFFNSEVPKLNYQIGVGIGKTTEKAVSFKYGFEFYSIGFKSKKKNPSDSPFGDEVIPFSGSSIGDYEYQNAYDYYLLAIPFSITKHFKEKAVKSGFGFSLAPAFLLASQNRFYLNNELNQVDMDFLDHGLTYFNLYTQFDYELSIPLDNKIDLYSALYFRLHLLPINGFGKIFQIHPFNAGLNLGMRYRMDSPKGAH